LLKTFQTPEARSAARERRAAYWDQPLAGRRQRLHAWWNMLFVDHGLIRMFYLNEHAVTDKLIRSAQPAPRDIRRFAAKGIRTIITLRGGREQGGWPLERETCDETGIVLRELTLRSREAPDRATLLSLPAFFETLAYPVVAHCKSGADRAGLFSALYLLVHDKRSVAEAKRQLSLKYGHIRLAKTGMLDAFLDAYAQEGEGKGLSFMDWVRDVYDPASVQHTFHEGFLASLIVDKIMRRE
jgi:protein tyrosine/serine phosphatase